MKTPIEIVNDAKAFVRSTATTVGAAAIGFTAFTAVLLGLGIVPEQYKAKLVAASTIAGAITVACRQIIAWLDPKNTSFGRVAIEPDPGASEPGDRPHEDVAIDVDLSGPEPEPNEADLTEEDISPPTDGPQEGGQ